jgi:hypothetical protein
MSDAKLVLVPPADAGIPPYANSTFMYSVNSVDVSILFLRMPLMTEEASKKLIAAGQNRIEGDIVGSITLPRQAAAQMADKLKELLGS